MGHHGRSVGHAGFRSVETPRLELRRFRPDDLGPFVAYRSDPDVARYQSWSAPYPVAAGRALLEGMARTHPGTPGAWFQFAVALRPSGELIGDCAACPDEHDPRLVEIGFTFAPSHQGRGYATEATTHLLAYLFTEQDGRPPAHRVSASCDVRNARSAALLERVGMRREAHHVESAWYGGEWTSEYGYALLRREWEQRARTRPAP